MWIVIEHTSFWHILNTATKKSKKIGKIGKGTNYHDMANKECLARNLRDYGNEVTTSKDGCLYDRAGNYAGTMEISEASFS